MRIAVHAKVLSEVQPTGIGVYTYNLLKQISLLDRENKYTLYSNKPLVRKVAANNFEEKILDFPKLWSYLRLPFEFVSNKYDLLFVPKEMLPPVKRPRTVIACFDLGYDTANIFSDRISFDARMHIWLSVNYALKRADKIISISESTKNDIIAKCDIAPDKIEVIYLGYDNKLYKPCEDNNSIESVREKYGITGSYIINSSSTLWYRKNLLGLLKAFRIFKSKKAYDCKLVITGKKGKAKDEDKILTLIKELDLSDDVLFTGYVAIEDMPLLFSGAEAMVFPSFHEGFGLPILEAMACGCPVITSNVSAMPEVVDDAGLLVDPHSTDDISLAIEKICGDRSLRDALSKKSIERARMFSWEKTARETLKVFESLK